MVWEILKNQKSKWKFIKKKVEILCFHIHEKNAFKMASEVRKYGSTKTWNCPASLAISKALNIHHANFLRPRFNGQFFLCFNFYFGLKTPGGKKNMRKLGLNF